MASVAREAGRIEEAIGGYSMFIRLEDLREETLASVSRAFDWRFDTAWDFVPRPTRQEAAREAP
jgi:hypothetical protein